ncbi:hypothetical protein SPAB_02759 [Salmonella enterica subsp. enterica serovar Paratyphi B str. SPB7]|uniref:Uncharacterized protein n=1 Tax=Salmonella paratyphi B (strain ATCC BAA-1250 / SPB7) TaxID=1016998 RepID=A0A6C6Z438_SALPB|nr:hypothetical protein SPAB_02759 [Salmonella enterica subsp. enterica serovar Paratyphi B str. SPB7]
MSNFHLFSTTINKIYHLIKITYFLPTINTNIMKM